MPVLNSASLASASIQKQLRIFRRILLIILVIIAVLGAVVGLCSMEDQVSGDGVVAGCREYLLRSPVDARVTAVELKSGDFCRRGRIVVQLDDSELQLEIDNIQRQLKSAAAGRSPEMSVLRNRLKVLESRVKNYSITAPDDGIAVEVSAWRGGFFRKGDALLKFAAVNPRQVLTHIHEKQIARIKPGLQVRISSPLYNYLDHGYFYGKVSSVEEVPVVRSGEVYFPVRINIDGNADRLRIGSSCRAVIITGRQRMLYNFFGIKGKNKNK